MIKRLAWTLAVPLGLIGAAALILLAWPESLLHLSSGLRRYGTIACLASAMLLSIGFNQIRYFLLLLAVTVIFLALLTQHPVNWPLVELAFSFSRESVAALTAVVFPVMAVLLALSAERGLINLRGLFRLSLVLVTLAAVLLLGQSDSAVPLDGLQTVILPRWSRLSTPLPDIALLLHGFAVISLVILALLRGGIIESGFLGVLLSLAAALHFQSNVPAMELFLALAGLNILIAVIRNSFHLAYIDELTGLPARRALQDQMMKLGGNYSIAMADVDHFKKFNDRYGHEVGDDVLRMVAKRLDDTQGRGKAYRYGGEEFTLLYPGKEKEQVMPYLEQVRQSIEKSLFVIRGKDRPKRKPSKVAAGSARDNKRVRVTISIGVADSTGREKIPGDVIQTADKALYRAKRKGRNRVSG